MKGGPRCCSDVRNPCEERFTPCCSCSLRSSPRWRCPRACADVKKPNILILWGDDIGYWNVSAYNQGMMGYKTPNIDRIAKEGALVHRLVRPAELHGRTRVASSPARSASAPGSLKVGLPGAKEGLQARDVTIAELLKASGLRDRTVRQEPPRRRRRARCRPCTGSTSSTARSTTSTPSRSRSIPTTSRIRR